MDEWIDQIPPGACCYALYSATTPWAIKDTGGRYVWVNRAFEELLGYSLAELRNKVWSELTTGSDVAAEQEAFQSLVDGTTVSFLFEKSYRPKRKVLPAIPAKCRASRWPPDSSVQAECVIMELIPCTIQDLRDITRNLNDRIDLVTSMIKNHEDAAQVSDARGVSVNVGNNSDRSIHVLAAAVVAIAIVVAWLAYYAVSRPGQEPPPSTPKITTGE